MAKVISFEPTSGIFLSPLNGKSYLLKWQKLFRLNQLLEIFTSPLNGKSYLLKWQKLFRLNQLLEFF